MENIDIEKYQDSADNWLDLVLQNLERAKRHLESAELVRSETKGVELHGAMLQDIRRMADEVKALANNLVVRS